MTQARWRVGMACAALMAVSAPSTRSQPVPPAAAIAIVGARLIDGTGGPVVEDSAVIVRGDRIAAAGPRARVPVPPDAAVIDATGRSLIPGLVDAHYHLNQPLDEMKRMFLVSLAWGVTTFRSIGSDRREAVPLYHAVQRGEVTGPRVYTAGQGFLHDLPSPGYPANTPGTPEEARAQVRDLKAQRVDFVKIWMRGRHLAPAIVAAIIDEARAQGLPMVVHVTEQATLRQIADQGVTDIMHEPIDGPITPELIAYIKSKRLSFVPTIANSEAGYYYLEHARFLGLPRRLDGFYAEGRARFLDPGYRTTVAANLAERKASVRAMLPFVKTMYDNGIRVVTGSDGGATGGTTPIGHATHRELQLFVEAGLPPLAAIRAATLDAARVLERTDDPGYGSVRAGKIADLVLLFGDPSANIADTEKIARVMRAGRWVDLR